MGIPADEVGWTTSIPAGYTVIRSAHHDLNTRPSFVSSGTIRVKPLTNDHDSPSAGQVLPARQSYILVEPKLHIRLRLVNLARCYSHSLRPSAERCEA